MSAVCDLLMVVENYNGARERNMLFTKDEFMSFLSDCRLVDTIDDVRFLLDNARSRFDWRTLYSAEGSMEFRCCRDEQDLYNFLTGEYNDSLNKMEARGVYDLARLDGFQWSSSLSDFSPNSRAVFEKLQSQNPALRGIVGLTRGNAVLDEVIAKATPSQGRSNKEEGRGAVFFGRMDGR